MGCWFSYFNESDLELAAGDLGHLDEEGRLVGVVFDDVVVHVDENPEEEEAKIKKVTSVIMRKNQSEVHRKWAKSKGISLFNKKKKKTDSSPKLCHANWL